MSIMAKASNFEQPDVGSWPGRCYSIIELGTQVSEWEGQRTEKYQVLISWELPTQDPMEDGRLRSISKFYTLSLSDTANLTKDLTSWRGKAFTAEEKEGFDIEKLLGVPAMLSLVEKKGKVRVDAVMGLPKGTPMPEQSNDSVVFELQAYIDGDMSVWNNLSEGLQGLVNKCLELQPGTVEHSMANTKHSAPPNDFDDTIPF